MSEFSTPRLATHAAEDDVGYPSEGLPGRTGELVQRLQRGTDYLRGLEPDALRADLEDRVRAHPLLSVALAAAAGFLLGRTIRG